MKRFYHKAAALLGTGMLILLTGSATLTDAATAVSPVTAPADVASTPAETSNAATLNLSIGTELMAGETSYRIGYPVTSPSGVVYEGYFPFSELEWPLDIWLARLDGSATINDQWRFNATLKKDLSTPGDPMVDSDWITASNPNRLDIYSESEISSFDAFIMDVDVEWTFLRRDTVSFYAGLGYIYQNLDYEAELIHQYSPSGLPGLEFYGDGRVAITYEMIYSIPYLKAGADLQVTPDLSFAGSFSFSPIVMAEDTDNHLLREYGGKINTGDQEGSSYMFDISGKYMFTPVLFMEAGFQYMNIEVDGDQGQAYGWGFPLGTAAQEAESTQTSGYLTLGYTF